MSDLTNEQIAHLENLSGKAWPAPWAADDCGIVDEKGERVALVYAKDGREKRWWWECENDTRDLIIAARNLLPSLLASLASARSELLNVHDALHRSCDGAADLPAEIRALRAERDALRSEVARLTEALRGAETLLSEKFGPRPSPGSIAGLVLGTLRSALSTNSSKEGG